MSQDKQKHPESLLEMLSVIQCDIKAKKSQWNKFGKYNYRKAEDILEALKPYLAVYGLTLNISEDMVQVGDRNYIKSTASLMLGSEIISATGFAREAIVQSGMQDAQLTGSTSSYAKKYSLGNLLALDDTSDADSINDGSRSSDTDDKSDTKQESKVDAPKRHSGKQMMDKDHVKYKGAKNAVSSGKYSISDILKTYDLSGDVLKEFEDLVKANVKK